MRTATANIQAKYRQQWREDLRAAILRAVSCAFNFDGMRWVTTYWDHEQERAYCVYEARDADELRSHAERARIPCGEVTSIFAINPEAC